MTEGFNLQEEFGEFLDLALAYISEMPDLDDDELEQSDSFSDHLEHFGVKGMRWGVRRNDSTGPSTPKHGIVGLGPDKIVRKTPNGETLTLTKDPPSLIPKMIARANPNMRERYNNAAFLTLRDGQGKKVGDAQVEKRADGELYLNWLGVKQHARGKGYATQTMKAAEEFGRKSGFKKMTLEVPGNSPDALHIYEKLGFKKTGVVSDDPDDAWGGLTSMEYKFENNVKHSMSPELQDYLLHAGVKGMKWGRRKKVDPSNNVERTSNTRRNIKIIGGVAAGVAMAAGAAYAVNTLNKKGKVSISSVATSSATSAGKNLLDLTLNNASTPRPSAGLNLGTPSRSSTPGGFTGGPSLSSLNNILSNTPQVSFDSKTGMYRTS